MTKLEKYIVGGVVVFVIAIAFIVAAHGQNPPTAPPAPDAVTLPEVSRLRLIVAYQKALTIKAQFDAVVAQFNEISETERKANNLPDGTRFDVRPDQNQVLVITPPKPEPPKPASSKPEEKKPEVKK